MHVSVAVVGGGPRGLSILERICGQPHTDWDSLTVHLIDPHPPGAGVHLPDQPNYLLMNTIAGQVTMFRTGDRSATGRPIAGPSLADWAGAAADSYLPRGTLGRYLAFAYRRLRRQAPPNVRIQEHRAGAHQARTLRDGSWVLHLSDGSLLAVDFVFLTTGHGTNQPTEEDQRIQRFVADHRRSNPDLRYLRSCYPLHQLDTIEPGSRVAVRGMSLSAIDTVAALTTGRGGRFLPGPDGELVYRPSGAEPRLRVYSRSGRIFAPRAVNQKRPTDVHQAAHLTLKAIDALRAEVGQLDFEQHLLPLLTADLREAAEATGGPLPDVAALLRPREHRFPRTVAAHQQDLVDFLTADERQAAAGNLTSPLKAATDAIRDLRTELRHAVEHRGLTPRSHEQFCQVYAPLLNAVAAGPPAHRSREWRALFAAGVLQLGAGPGGSLRLDSERAEFAITGAVQSSPPVHCDVLVGASVDPFLPERDTAPLTRSLLAGGHARPFTNGWFHPGGFDIDQVGRLVRADGTITPNFCALGHPTEGAHYFTNMLPAPGVDSRVTADAEAAVRAMAEHLRHTVAHRANPLPVQGVAP
ncbi:putative NAD(P)/FAD-binding protein YdhS [Kitasatospora sp. GP30]|uniref:FAD/NAD(P)-binding protein n=1 Tax=Kitasatospora sp. GP30 TaxID=3035084 RepID=UPI000C70C86B|nr:FAD/NAD(P)-binding domain-containing protein [Kitasatospora sp. GP30]MDH6143619.1 putative NAD(P)/FAD-binding protein YdhS [Kitasatospora sp. GP30]